MEEKNALRKKKQYNFNLPRFEYWYDPNPEHLGSIRIIDYKEHKIYGSDPDLPYWTDLENRKNRKCNFYDSL
jgi:hypothetical protein